MANIQPFKPPPVNIPAGDNVCDVSIINTTTEITAPTYFLVEPQIPGHRWINLPVYAFHIVHKPTNRHLLFDLGARKDWYNSVPHIVGLINDRVPGVKITKNTDEILVEGGVDLKDVDTVILSHWHFDHTGDTSVLPKHIKLIVGPGFKDAFLPGFPTKEDSPFPESAFEGREVVEVVFSDKSHIGKYQAIDFFDDGSLYLLNIPGHATGHMGALVRTTSDTAIFLGADTCHFTGSVRPSQYIPMPDTLPPQTAMDTYLPRPCPCVTFTACHPNPAKSREVPFYNVSKNKASFYTDPSTAELSIDALKEFDADPNVLLIIAHDTAPPKALNFFPNGTLNDWKEKGHKEAMHWAFVNELPYEGQARRPPLVDGLYRDGENVRGLEIGV